MPESSSQYDRADGVTAEPSGDRTVVLDPDGARVNTLSPVGSLVWQSLPADLSEVVDRLKAAFPEVARSTLLVDAESFLQELIDARLIVEVDAQR